MSALLGAELDPEEMARRVAGFAHRLCRARGAAVAVGSSEGLETLVLVGGLSPSQVGGCERWELAGQGALYLLEPEEHPLLATVVKYGGLFLAQASRSQTERQQLQRYRERHQELSQSQERLAQLLGGLPELSGEISRETLLEGLGQQLRRIFPGHSSAVLVLSGTVHWLTGAEGEGLDELLRLCQESPGGVHFDDLRTTRLTPLSSGDRSVLGYPAVPQGALLVGSERAGAFRHEDWMALSVLARHVSAAWEVIEAYGQLVQSAKLAAVGQLAAGVAHELNNPLGSIQLALDLCRRKQVAPELQRPLEAACRSVDRAREIIRKLLYFSRESPSVPQPLEVNAVVREAWDLFRLQLEPAGVELELDLAEAPLRVLGQAGELVQVLGNLLLNALAAVKEGPVRQVRVRTWGGGGWVGLGVSDSGPGVPEAIRERIFDPFFTTRPVGEGTGLGLSVSRQIARRYGGSLEYREGVFELRLPALD